MFHSAGNRLTPTSMSLTQLSIFNQVAEIQISYRNEVPAYQRPKVTCSDDAYRYFLNSWEQDQLDYCEKFKGNATEPR